jgi:transcriptional regulator with XRE-family HTH domain
MEAGAALREARTSAGLSQRQLAERTGTSQATISAYENGRKRPSFDTFHRLLAATESRLVVVRDGLAQPTALQLQHSALVLDDVLDLADHLPVRHGGEPSSSDPSQDMPLKRRVVEIHRALSEAGIPHGFGGAIALAYWIRNPRGTSDVDVNVFLPAAEPEPALAALPAGIDQPPGTLDRIARDGQVRLWWGKTPVDLFFNNLPIHERAARHRRTVPFDGEQIQILGPVELAVFKAMFDRPQDWVDIEAMVAADALDVDAVRAGLDALLGPDDPRLERLAEAARRGRATAR